MNENEHQKNMQKELILNFRKERLQMIELYETYPNEEMRQNAFMLESANINCDKALFAFNVASKSESIRLREAELACVAGGGN